DTDQRKLALNPLTRRLAPAISAPACLMQSGIASAQIASAFPIRFPKNSFQEFFQSRPARQALSGVERQAVCKMCPAGCGTRVCPEPFDRMHGNRKGGSPWSRIVEPGRVPMMPETQVHTIARQMFEKHGPAAIAAAAQKAQACENNGDAEEAREWRHIEEAMKMMRGPHQS